MKFRQRPTRSIIAVAVMVILALAATACGGSDDEESSDTTAAEGSSTTIGTATADEVRLGFFPNVTHAPALVGVEEGFFEGKLGDSPEDEAAVAGTYRIVLPPQCAGLGTARELEANRRKLRVRGRGYIPK